MFKKNHVPWNKDLTKETDIRISLYAKKIRHPKKWKLGSKPKHWLGKNLSEEHKNKIREGNKTTWLISPIRRKKCQEKFSGKNNPMYGKKRPDLAERNMQRVITGDVKGERNPFFGKKHTEETKKKISEIMLGPHNPFRGKHFSKEHKEKISQKHKSLVTEEWKDKMRKVRLRTVIPFRDTTIEVALQNGLRKERLTFVTHFPIFGQPDIAFPEKKIAVFADGTYWHSNLKSIERDNLVNKTLNEMGWEVIRFSETEIRESPSICVLKIKKEVV